MVARIGTVVSNVSVITSRKMVDRSSIGPISSMTTSFRVHRFTDRCNTDSLQLSKIEAVLSNALRRFEINVSKDSLFAVERDEFKSDAHAALADFLSVKAAGWQCQILHDPLNQCSLAAPGAASQQYFASHFRVSSGNARRTTRCGRQPWPISIRARNADIFHPFPDVAEAMISASGSN
jgi:hypothetical protein